MNRRVLDLLERYECRNILFRDPAAGWPIVWERALGVHVWDADQRRYLDLTAAFGVAAAGHANPRVVRAGQLQMAKLLHAMGDVHPHALKGQLARELSRLTFERWTRHRSGKTLFCNSGFEAVEAALKTAMLATARPGVIAFTGAYHGVGYGTLNATHRDEFSLPFRPQLKQFGHFLPFPDTLTLRESAGATLNRLARAIKRISRQHAIGAILVEPVQGRGGIRVPPAGFLPLLRRLCDQVGALLIVDEIYTGFGRTGRWFACEHSRTVPDLICLGKALTGGFPLSACVGDSKVMDKAWPRSQGEAIHTSTFLGHPVGCAMALANIAEIKRRGLVERSAELGTFLQQQLARLKSSNPAVALRVRGLGLMAGLELVEARSGTLCGGTIPLVQEMLRRGFILLPEGDHAQVIAFTPPLTITQAQLRQAVRALESALAGINVGVDSGKRLSPT